MHDEHGSSSALAFIVAGVMFLAAVGILLFTVENEVPSEQDVETGYRAPAEAVLALLVESPGVGWNTTSSNWTAGTFRPSLVNELRNISESRLMTWRTCGSVSPCLVYSDVQEKLGLGSLSFNMTLSDASGAVVWSYGPRPPLAGADQTSDAATVPVRRGTPTEDFAVTVRVFAS